MSEGLQAILNDDGVFEEYDDTYDFTIHCESEEEQEEVLNKLNWRWIPVSERLPEWGEEVLMINNDGNYEINHIIDDERNEWFNDDDIVAWMPLPEPYKAESEDKE